MSNSKIIKNKIFLKSINGSAIFVTVLLLAFFLTLLVSSWPALKANGISFLWGKTWDPNNDHYGMLPFLIGTLITSFLALLISAPFSIAAALFLGEYFPKGLIPNIFRNIIDLLAAIPSVVYGFWGLFTIVPLVRAFEIKMHMQSSGLGIFSASLVLSIMLIPYSVSLIRQVISMTPIQLKEAAYALGSTRTEVIMKVILPANISGISAGFLLSLGRALGETMAVTVLIGNSPKLPTGIFSPSNTMASLIANEFNEAVGTVYPASLVEIGLLLFVVTTVINLIGRIIIKRYTVKI
ncbi:MAG TPA: phosphate ABC transporter permease subunit PstC [Bacteroidia bacterium]|nr:phosphate ABC transporter permease subunit PstC [Bacteroidia bacterium]